jgi:hypothetical protein
MSTHHYEIYDNKEIVILQKSAFLYFETLESVVIELKEIPNNIKFIVNETGEAFESSANEYIRFSELLKKYNLNNTIIILTETEIVEYFDWIKSFGWIPITWYGFFDTIEHGASFNGEVEWMKRLHIPYWLFSKVPHIKTEPFKKKFLTLNRSYRNNQHQHRMDLYHYLKDNDLLNESYASFKFIPEFDNNFGEVCTWDEIRDLNKHYLHLDKQHIWDDAFLNILCESRISNHILNVVTGKSPDIVLEFQSDYFTEKLTKTIASNMPFVLIGVKGLLARMHKLGFKTFGDFWDESYDMLDSYEERFEKIKEIIQWVASKDLDELKDLYNQMIPIFEHNKIILDSIDELNRQSISKYVPKFYN